MIPLLSGFYVRFGDALEPALNRQIHALTARLLENPLPGVTDLIPGYTTLFVEYDARTLSGARVRAWVEAQRERETGLEQAPEPFTVEIPVVYDGEDLPEIAQRTGLSIEEVIAKHAAPRYDVYALGFTPGFAFMGEVDPALRLPRRPSPRARVPAHSVATANHQTGVYPTPSPGGWNLLGRTLVRLYDPHRDAPFLLGPGNRVRFIPSQGEPPGEFAPLELLPREPTHPFLRVLEPGLLDLVMDEGRFMGGRYGLSRSGPLDARSAGLANALLGNFRGAALLELNLRGGTFEALATGVVAFAGWGMVPVVNGQEVEPFESFGLEQGDVLSFRTIPHGSRGYLALAGGLGSGRFWGSASVDVRGKLGRPLEAGDVLGVAEVRSPRPGYSFVPYGPFQDPTVLRLLPGPQASAEALTALCGGTFRVGSADRMGVCLEGPRVPGGDVLSEAVPLGAVQVTSQGDPIVLLNDRGTLGGYAKPARLHPADLPKAAQLGPGSEVRFRRG